MSKILRELGNKQIAMRLAVLATLLFLAMIVLTVKTQSVGSTGSSTDSTYLPSTGRIANQTRMDNESTHISVLLSALSGLPAKLQPQNGKVILR